MRMKLRAGEFDSQDETTKLHYLLSRTRNGPFMRLKVRITQDESDEPPPNAFTTATECLR
jgi:hypothetical protein